MYFGTARLFDGGHESTGVSEGATSWFLAEGATGPFFETFVLVGNPNPVAANVTFTFLTGDGQSVVRTKIVPANGRLTVNIEDEDPILANAAVSTRSRRISRSIAERAMYWPGPPSTWAEAHNSFGSTACPRGGAWPKAASAWPRLSRPTSCSRTRARPRRTSRSRSCAQNGTTVVKTFTVAPTSRFNVDVSSAAPELQNEALRGADRGPERGRHQRGAGDVFGRPGPDLGRRHERPGHPPAVGNIRAGSPSSCS